MPTKMIGRKIPTCCMGDRCCNAHDSLGRKIERRLAKRREKQQLLHARRADWDG